MAAPGNLRRSPGVLGLVHAVRAPVAGDFTAHHRGTTPNRAGNTHLGQARLQPHHNRRAIPNTQHPTTSQPAPPTALLPHKMLTPYDTAHVSQSLSPDARTHFAAHRPVKAAESDHGKAR